jgi:hypothetical protein
MNISWPGAARAAVSTLVAPAVPQTGSFLRSRASVYVVDTRSLVSGNCGPLGRCSALDLAFLRSRELHSMSRRSQQPSKHMECCMNDVRANPAMH